MFVIHSTTAHCGRVWETIVQSINIYVNKSDRNVNYTYSSILTW